MLSSKPSVLNFIETRHLHQTTMFAFVLLRPSSSSFLKHFYARKNLYQTDLSCPYDPPEISILCSTLTTHSKLNTPKQSPQYLGPFDPQIAYISIFYGLSNSAHHFLDLRRRYCSRFVTYNWYNHCSCHDNKISKLLSPSRRQFRFIQNCCNASQ